MNDPGFDPAITETAENVENGKQDGLSMHSVDKDDPDTSLRWVSADRELSEFLQPVKWWYASTEIPLIAATIGPMASAFNICSLADRWRQITQPGQSPVGSVHTLVDPTRVIAMNSASLAVALVANFSLLMTMTKRIPFNIAQPIVIVGWYLSSVLLAVVLITTHYSVRSERETTPGLEFTEAYYYGAIASALYFVLSTLLIVTVYGAYKGHYSPEFHLTKSQRTLMVQNTGFLMYLMAGSAIYANIEGWRFTDAVWWSDFTILTIGIGYPSPTTHLGRGLLFPYAIGGILILGIVVSSIRSLVMERGKAKMGSRLIERTRQAGVKRMMSKYGHGNGKNTKFWDFNPFRVKMDTGDYQDEEIDEEERRRREFQAMRRVRQIAHVEHRWLSLLTSTMAVATLWLVGALIFQHAEGTQQWSYFDGLYYAYTTLLTIGYGDIYDISNWGRVFFVFWSLLAVPTMTIFISNLGNTVIIAFRDFMNYIGEITFLPGEMGYRERFKQFCRQTKALILLSEEEEPTPNSETANDNGNGPVEHAGEVLAEAQLEEEEEARQRGDIAAENIHHHQYLLIKELRQMYQHLNATPPKEFEYEEWVYFLKLLGEEETYNEYHRKPYSSHPKDGEEEKTWSWIGHRSPLLGDKQEAEWLVEALSDKLERGLKRLRDEKRDNNYHRRSQRPSSSNKQ
jgi:potassium channel subfamily K